MTIFRQMSHISTMFTCAAVTASLFTQQQLMSPWPCELCDSVAMLPSSLTSLSEPIGEGVQPAEGCDLQSSLASLQGSVCDSLTGPVNSNTQTRTTLTQHDPTLPAACLMSYHILKSKEQEKNPLLRSDFELNINTSFIQ